MYQIRINALEGGGYEMNVGCQRFFYGTHAAMMTELSNFMEHPQIVERQYNHFKAQISDAKDASANPLRTTLGGGSEWAPGTVINRDLGAMRPGSVYPANTPGFEYQESIHGIRFTNSPKIFTGPSTGEISSADGMSNMAGAIRP